MTHIHPCFLFKIIACKSKFYFCFDNLEKFLRKSSFQLMLPQYIHESEKYKTFMWIREKISFPVFVEVWRKWKKQWKLNFNKIKWNVQNLWFSWKFSRSHSIVSLSVGWCAGAVRHFIAARSKSFSIAVVVVAALNEKLI